MARIEISQSTETPTITLEANKGDAEAIAAALYARQCAQEALAAALKALDAANKVPAGSTPIDMSHLVEKSVTETEDGFPKPTDEIINISAGINKDYACLSLESGNSYLATLVTLDDTINGTALVLTENLAALLASSMDSETAAYSTVMCSGGDVAFLGVLPDNIVTLILGDLLNSLLMANRAKSSDVYLNAAFTLDGLIMEGKNPTITLNGIPVATATDIKQLEKRITELESK